MCPSRDILGTLQVGTGWGPDALGELQWKTVPSRLPHKTPQMGQLVNDKHDFSALWHPASPGSAVWRSSSCPLLVPLTAPSPGRRDVGFLWVLIALLRAPPHALSTHLFSIAFGGGGSNIRITEAHRHQTVARRRGASETGGDESRLLHLRRVSTQGLSSFWKFLEVKLQSAKVYTS